MNGKLMKKLTAAALLAAALTSVPAVSSSLGLNTKAEAAVKISKKKLTLTVGQKATLKMKGTKKKVTWKSANKKIATVSKKGVVTAKAAGKVKITAKVKGKRKKYTCVVTVKAASANTTTTTKKAEPWMTAYLDRIKERSTNFSGGYYPCEIFLYDFCQDGIPEMVFISHNTKYNFTYEEYFAYDPDTKEVENFTVGDADSGKAQYFVVDTKNRNMYFYQNDYGDKFLLRSIIRPAVDRDNWYRYIWIYSNSENIYRWIAEPSAANGWSTMDDISAEEYWSRRNALEKTYVRVNTLATKFTEFNKEANQIDWDKYLVK